MAKKKILIIDDEENFTEMVKITLEDTGKYEVKTENKALSGLAVVKKFKPNLILLDVVMPDKSGDEVAFEIINDKSVKDIPIVFLTAAVTKDEVYSQGGTIAGRPFITKPVSVDELIRYIEKNLKV